MNTAELSTELATLSAGGRRLTASEERRRAWLIRELADQDRTRGVAEAAELGDRWLALEHSRDRETEQ